MVPEPDHVAIGELAADLYLPPATEGRVPALVTVLPYRKDSALGVILGATALSWFASQGYAALLVDLGGTGASGGDPRPPFSPDEADDCIAAIEWAASQPWCDGNVGMWGHSYGGLLTLRAAAARPPALKAIVPVEPLVDPWTDFLEPGGLEPLQWGAMTLMTQLQPPSRHADATPYISYLFEDRPWSAVDVTTIDVPALVFGGWRDLFCDATVRAFEAMRGPKQLVMGPWTHELPNVAAVAPVDFLGMALRWFDRWLRDVDNGADADPPLRFFVQAENAWRTFSAFEAENVALHRAGDGDGSDPTIGTCSGLFGSTAALPFAPDQRDDDALSLCFDSEPLVDAITIVGRPVIDTDAIDEIVVRLCDVAPDGTSTLISAHRWPTAYRIESGHRLRVAISTNDFPRRRRREGTPKVATIDVRLPIATGTPIDMPSAPPPSPELFALGEWAPPALSIERGAITFSQRSRVGNVAMHQETRATVDDTTVTLTTEVDGTVVTVTATSAGAAAPTWSVR